MPLRARLVPRLRDLGGGFTVRRVLPDPAVRAVGPFVFFDHFGPIVQRAGEVHDVRPHPHIGLATVTWLFEGAMMHRDSLGVVQRIEPGEINWMTAGRGIVHSERTPPELRDRDRALHGLQLWVALPAAAEEAEPAFTHVGRGELPTWSGEGASVTVLVGARALGGARLASPVRTFGGTLYLDVRLAPGGRLRLDGEAEELAVYPVEGAVRVDGEPLAEATMGVLAGRAATVEAAGPARLVVVGGDPLDGPRTMWWNFVSSRPERVRQAADDWEADRFPPVPGDDERIPLPER